MLGATPGAYTVTKGSVSGYGHFQQVPMSFTDESGVVVSMPSVVVADEYFTGLGLVESSGTAAGIGQQLTVGSRTWYVRAIEPGESPGEIRVFLSNRP